MDMDNNSISSLQSKHFIVDNLPEDNLPAPRVSSGFQKRHRKFKANLCCWRRAKQTLSDDLETIPAEALTSEPAVVESTASLDAPENTSETDTQLNAGQPDSAEAVNPDVSQGDLEKYLKKGKRKKKRKKKESSAEDVKNANSTDDKSKKTEENSEGESDERDDKSYKHVEIQTSSGFIRSYGSYLSRPFRRTRKLKVLRFVDFKSRGKNDEATDASPECPKYITPRPWVEKDNKACGSSQVLPPDSEDQGKVKDEGMCTMADVSWTKMKASKWQKDMEKSIKERLKLTGSQAVLARFGRGSVFGTSEQDDESMTTAEKHKARCEYMSRREEARRGGMDVFFDAIGHVPEWRDDDADDVSTVSNPLDYGKGVLRTHISSINQDPKITYYTRNRSERGHSPCRTTKHHNHPNIGATNTPPWQTPDRSNTPENKRLSPDWRWDGDSESYSPSPSRGSTPPEVSITYASDDSSSTKYHLKPIGFGPLPIQGDYHTERCTFRTPFPSSSALSLPMPDYYWQSRDGTYLPNHLDQSLRALSKRMFTNNAK